MSVTFDMDWYPRWISVSFASSSENAAQASQSNLSNTIFSECFESTESNVYSWMKIDWFILLLRCIIDPLYVVHHALCSFWRGNIAFRASMAILATCIEYWRRWNWMVKWGVAVIFIYPPDHTPAPNFRWYPTPSHHPTKRPKSILHPRSYSLFN